MSKSITIELPESLAVEVTRLDTDVPAFVATAVEREVERRRRENIDLALERPHPESLELAELGIADWAAGLPEESLSDFCAPDAGQRVRWIRGVGWQFVNESEPEK